MTKIVYTTADVAKGKAMMAALGDTEYQKFLNDKESRFEQATKDYPLDNDRLFNTQPPGAVIGGTKFDSEKPRMDLLDADFLEGVANVLTFGARKYAAHNWRSGINYSRLIAGLYRHLGAINRGEDFDPESGFPHTYHLGCNAMFLASMMNKHKELDDRWKETK